MEDIDITSVIVAGVLGAVLLFAIDYAMSLPDEGSPMPTILGAGFAVGAGVQVGVRLLGVS
jgi:hypothetical protein